MLKQIEHHVQQGCGDNKLSWICARQHIASAFREAIQDTLPWIDLVYTQPNTTGFNQPMNIAHLCSFKRHLQSTASEALALDIVSRVEPVCLLRQNSCGYVAEAIRDIDESRGWAHLRMASEDVPATLAKADDLHSQECLFKEALYKAAVNKPAVADEDDSEIDVYGDEVEEKEAKTEGDGEGDDAKDDDMDGEDARDADDDGAGELMAAMPEPDVEAEASRSAEPAAARFFAWMDQPPVAIWPQPNSKGSVRACVPVRVKYSADEPKSQRAPKRPCAKTTQHKHHQHHHHHHHHDSSRVVKSSHHHDHSLIVVTINKT